MIRSIAIDDEPPALNIISNYCSQIDFIDLQKTFTKPQEALKYLSKFPVDLIFLDINMPSLSGIAINKKIPQDALVIFTTAHAEYAVEGFNLNAVDYLLKPFSFHRFEQAVKKAKEIYHYKHQSKKAENQFLFVRADYSLIKIALVDILYVEGLDDYLKIYLSSDRKPVVARMTMKEMMEKLPEKEFLRVHRSFIIPVNKIESIRNRVISVSGKEIRIGVSYEKEFFTRFKE